MYAAHLFYHTCTHTHHHHHLHYTACTRYTTAFYLTHHHRAAPLLPPPACLPAPARLPAPRTRLPTLHCLRTHRARAAHAHRAHARTAAARAPAAPVHATCLRTPLPARLTPSPPAPQQASLLVVAQHYQRVALLRCVRGDASRDGRATRARAKHRFSRQLCQRDMAIIARRATVNLLRQTVTL